MEEKDNRLFQSVDRRARGRWNSYRAYYTNDSKPFYDKLVRDYRPKGRFPVHVLRAIKEIPVGKYDSAVCILRGGLPYAALFEAEGWNVHYLICGRRNGEMTDDKSKLRFSKSVDKSLPQIAGKKILLIDNNSFTGNTQLRTASELEKAYGIKKPDLFLDYFVPNGPFKEDKEAQSKFGHIYVASDEEVRTEAERKRLIEEFLSKLRNSR